MSQQKFTAFNFNARSVAPAEPMSAVPAGWYVTTLTEAEVKPTSRNNGTMIAATAENQTDPYKGRKCFPKINVQNQNPDAQRIGQALLSAICHSVDVLDVSDVSQLCNRPFLGQWKMRPARGVNKDGDTCAYNAPEAVENYEASNDLIGAKPLNTPGLLKEAAGTAAAPTGAVAGAPSWANKGPATPPPPPTGAAPTPPAAPAGFTPPPAPPAPPAAAPVAPPPPPPVAATPPPPPAPAVVAAREFYVNLGPGNTPLHTEAQVAEFLKAGMPGEMLLCLKGSQEWKAASTFGIGVSPTPPAVPAGFPPPPTSGGTAATPFAPWGAGVPTKA